jgi:hypothetical protein
MAILLLGGNLDDLVEIVTDTEWGEVRLKFCYFSIKLVNMPCVAMGSYNVIYSYEIYSNLFRVGEKVIFT